MGISERRQREKEQRRNLILDAAESVFFARGMRQATMDDVAEEAELSKGTLYLYFQSKEELYLGITCRALELLKEMFQEAIARHTTGIEKIRTIGETYYQYSRKYASYFHVIQQYELSQLDKSLTGEMLKRCHQAGSEVMRVVADAVATGINDGTIRQDLHPVKTAYLLQGLSNGIIQLIAREKDHIKQYEDFPVQELMKDFMNFMYHALRSTPECNTGSS